MKHRAGSSGSACAHSVPATASPSEGKLQPPVSNVVVCVPPLPRVQLTLYCNGRMVKTEVLPWAYWNFMMRGYVPWSEAKNYIKSLKDRLQQWREAPASLPQ